jgi:hypothetical protein
VRKFGWVLLIAGATQSYAVNIPGGLKAEPPKVEKAPPWMLGAFLELIEKDSERLLRISEKLLSPDRMSQASRDPVLAFEWQHRLAAVTALADFFDPALKFSDASKTRARELIQSTILSDPALLVRDGAVESVRRLMRMEPGEAKKFQVTLEKAFMDRKNVSEGEGFFIRETILVAMNEGLMKPSARIKNAAQQDANPSVRTRLGLWRSRTYDVFPGK